jgi:hypothetical protein
MRQFFLCLLFGFALWSDGAVAATLGKCKFDVETQTFAGSAKDQAACLLRKVKILGNVDGQLAVIPPNLAGVIGQPTGVSKAKLRQFIAGLGLDEAGLGGSLDAALSHGNNNNPHAPLARYFVIHDTSSPNFGNKPFPSDIDASNQVNGLSPYKSAANAKAHVFLNRRGELYIGHEFSVPWRATKLENKIGIPSKGMFLHIENIQPRRAHPQQADGNAPTPGFTPAQYDRLALLYVAASVRGGTGLVPAFHAAIDQGLSDGHDDPQNFSLDEFDAALGRVLENVK